MAASVRPGGRQPAAREGRLGGVREIFLDPWAACPGTAIGSSRTGAGASSEGQHQRGPGRPTLLAELQMLVETGRGDVPLIHLRFRRRCGSCTGIICSSKYGGRPAWNREGT